MKKFLKVMSVAAMACALGFGFTACDDSEKEEETPGVYKLHFTVDQDKTDALQGDGVTYYKSQSIEFDYGEDDDEDYDDEDLGDIEDEESGDEEEIDMDAIYEAMVTSFYLRMESDATNSDEGEFVLGLRESFDMKKILETVMGDQLPPGISIDSIWDNIDLPEEILEMIHATYYPMVKGLFKIENNICSLTINEIQIDEAENAVDFEDVVYEELPVPVENWKVFKVKKDNNGKVESFDFVLSVNEDFPFLEEDDE